MNLYKKINTYLLENHPLVWHSKVVQLSLTGIILWLVSYVAGYVSTDIYDLQKDPYTSLYSSNGYNYFHSISILIILCLWAIYFFRNNAYKRYYPLTKGYFTKLFFLLFIPFLFILSAYIPFEIGAKQKTTKLLHGNVTSKEWNTINTAYPFLLETTDAYLINQRNYPSPFPVPFIFFDENEKKWSSENLTYKNNPYDIEHSTDIIELDGRKYLFYKDSTYYESPDSCISQSTIIKFYKLDELKNIQRNSILNFSKILIEKIENQEFTEWGYYNDYSEDEKNENYKKYIAPKVHELINQNNHIGVQKVLQDFIDICDRYKVGTNINSKLISNYLKAKNYSNIDFQIISTNFSVNLIPIHKIQYASASELISKVEATGKNPEDYNSETMYYYDKEALQTILENKYRLEGDKFKLKDNISLNVSLFIALGLAWLFIFFEFTTLPSFLISLPILGVLIIINSLFSFVMTSGNFDIFINFSSVITVIILLITLIGIKSGTFKRKILAVFINLTYIISSYLLYYIIYFIGGIKKHEVVHLKCEGENTTTSYPYDFLFHPLIFFIASLLGILLFFLVLRKWKAYKE